MSQADYFFSDTVYDPSNDPCVKLAVCLGVGWGVYVCLNSGKKNRQTPQRRKHRASLTLGHIDKQIDGRNFATGKKLHLYLIYHFIQDITIIVDDDQQWYHKYNR